MAHELGQAKNFSSCQSVERGAAAWEKKIDIKPAAEAKKSKYFSKYSEPRKQMILGP